MLKKNRLLNPLRPLLSTKKGRIYFYALLILVSYSFGLIKHVAKHENKITSLFYLGSRFTRPAIVEAQNPYVYPDSDGYDGQFYLLIAMDPFFFGGFASFIPSPNYFYTRILLPAVAHVTAFGQLTLVPYTYVLLNLLGLTGGCYFFWRIIRFYGANDAYILLYAISLGMYIAIERMLPDALAVNLLAAAIYCHLTGNRKGLLISLTLSVLAKEIMVLLPIAFLASAVWQEKKVTLSSLAYLIPVFALLLWQGIIRLAIGLAVPPAVSLTLPFLGIMKRVLLLMEFWPGSLIELVNILSLTLLALYSLCSSVRRSDPLRLAFAAYGLLFLCLHDSLILLDVHGYSRIAQSLIVFSLITFFRERKTMLLFPSFLMFGEALHMLCGGKFPIYI